MSKTAEEMSFMSVICGSKSHPATTLITIIQQLNWSPKLIWAVKCISVSLGNRFIPVVQQAIQKMYSARWIITLAFAWGDGHCPLWITIHSHWNETNLSSFQDNANKYQPWFTLYSFFFITFLSSLSYQHTEHFSLSSGSNERSLFSWESRQRRSLVQDWFMLHTLVGCYAWIIDCRSSMATVGSWWCCRNVTLLMLQRRRY